MSEPEGEDLARWLQESGRRKAGLKAAGLDASSGRETRQARGEGRYCTRPSLLILIALMVASFLQYYYTDVYLQITLLRHVIVFVPS